MSRDFDSTIPIMHTWELVTSSPAKRVYEHSDRYARVEFAMDDDTVTEATLYKRQESDEWVTTASVTERSEHPNAHANEIVHEIERCFGLHADDYPLRDTSDESEIIVAEDDSEVVDNTESKQASMSDYSSEIIVAEDDSVVYSD
jgi:hypothetical protein